SWSSVTLTPYLHSLLRAAPAVSLVADTPLLVRLHVFCAFAIARRWRRVPAVAARDWIPRAARPTDVRRPRASTRHVPDGRVQETDRRRPDRLVEARGLPAHPLDA